MRGLKSLLCALSCALASQATFAQLIIEDVQPPFGGQGDIINIFGQGFGNDPDDLCLISMSGPVSIPLEVLEANDNNILARVGVVRPDAQPGPIAVAKGEGLRDVFVPAFPDIIINEPVWVWDFVKPFEETLGPVFEPIPTPPNPDEVWFHSLPPENGQMCIFIEGFWKDNTKIRLSGRVREHAPPFRGHDMFAIDIDILEGGDAVHCAEKICDILRCAWEQLLGMNDVECFVEPIGPNLAKIILTIPGGSIDWGNVDLCVSPPPNPGPTLMIDDVFPATGGIGDIVTVIGSGFGDDPDDLCMIAMDGAVSVPFEVLTATDTELTARLGAVLPDAQPGPVMLAKGEGVRDVFDPVFPDIIVQDPVWVWDFVEPFEEVAGPVFTPVPTPPDPEFKWYFSGPPEDGVLCVIIDGYWKPNSIVTVSGRAREHSPPFRGHDLFAVDILLTEGGSALHCAERICDVLICAWEQLLGQLDLDCIVEPLGPNSAKITLIIPGGSIDWGNLNVCVSPVPNQVPPLVVDDVFPPFGGLNDIVTITGSGFGDDPLDLCVLTMDGPVSIPFEVLDTTDTEITARVGVVRPDAQPGPVMVARGEGFEDVFKPVFPDIVVNEPVWVWDFVEPFDEVAGPPFEPMPTPPGEEVVWFHSEAPENGQLCIFVNGFWKPNSKIVLSGRVREHVPPFRGHDLFAINIDLTEGGNALHCAERICDILQCAWTQILGDSDIACFVEPIGPNEAKIILTIPGGNIDWGNVDLCVSPPPNEPCAADCNMDGALNILDFVCFQNEWVAQTAYGDCDGNGAWNILDFVCYQNLYTAGCP